MVVPVFSLLQKKINQHNSHSEKKNYSSSSTLYILLYRLLWKKKSLAYLLDFWVQFKFDHVLNSLVNITKRCHPHIHIVKVFFYSMSQKPMSYIKYNYSFFFFTPTTLRFWFYSEVKFLGGSWALNNLVMAQLITFIINIYHLKNLHYNQAINQV